MALVLMWEGPFQIPVTSPSIMPAFCHQMQSWMLVSPPWVLWRLSFGWALWLTKILVPAVSTNTSNGVTVPSVLNCTRPVAKFAVNSDVNRIPSFNASGAIVTWGFLVIWEIDTWYLLHSCCPFSLLSPAFAAMISVLPHYWYLFLLQFLHRVVVVSNIH